MLFEQVLSLFRIHFFRPYHTVNQYFMQRNVFRRIWLEHDQRKREGVRKRTGPVSCFGKRPHEALHTVCFIIHSQASKKEKQLACPSVTSNGMLEKLIIRQKRALLFKREFSFCSETLRCSSCTKSKSFNAGNAVLSCGSWLNRISKCTGLTGKHGEGAGLRT